jgi:hypothetical protein
VAGSATCDGAGVGADAAVIGAACGTEVDGFSATYTMPDAANAPAAKASTIFEFMIMASDC